MTGRPAGLLFDLDGVLVDSTPDVVRHWQTFANEHGRDPAHVLARIHGAANDTASASCWPTGHRPRSKLRRSVTSSASSPRSTAPSPSPAPHSCSHGLTASTGPSSPPHQPRSPPPDCAPPGLPQPKALVSAEHVERGKPDPQGYALAAQRLALTPAQCVVFEDTPAGIIAARAAGMRVVALATTHTAAQLRAAVGKLEWIAADLRELPDTLP